MSPTLFKRKLPFVLLLSALMGAPAAAQAADFDFSINFGTTDRGWSAGPQLAYVRPGVYAVVNSPQSIFLANGFYWTQRGSRWYRASDRGDHWRRVRRWRVPHRVRRLPVARYRNIRPAGQNWLVFAHDVRGRWDGRGGVPPRRIRHDRWNRGRHDHRDQRRWNRGRGHDRWDHDRDRRHRGRGRWDRDDRHRGRDHDRDDRRGRRWSRDDDDDRRDRNRGRRWSRDDDDDDRRERSRRGRRGRGDRDDDDRHERDDD